MNVMFFLILILTTATYADEPINLGGPLMTIIEDGKDYDNAKLYESTSSETYPYEIRYGSGQRAMLTKRDYQDLKELVENYASRDTWYEVLRKKGYRRGIPIRLDLTVKNGELDRQNPKPGVTLVEGAGNALLARVSYFFEEGHRVNDRLVHNGEMTFSMKGVNIYKVDSDRKLPLVKGKSVTVEEVLKAEREGAGHAESFGSQQRFVVDFGEQFIGDADRERRTRSMPIAVVGRIVRNDSYYVLFVPIDKHKDFLEGKLSLKDTYLIPEAELQSVGLERWENQRLLYRNLRNRTRPEQIFSGVFKEEGQAA